MPESFHPRPLLGQTFPVGGGVRVRLRLAYPSDVRAIAELLAQDGGDHSFEAGALVQFDPRRRYVLCATALIDSAERLVGVGAIDLRGEEIMGPELLIVDPKLEGAVTDLLWDALIGAAEAAAGDEAA